MQLACSTVETSGSKTCGGDFSRPFQIQEATEVAPTGLRKSWFFIFQCLRTGYQPAHLECRIVKPCRYQLGANAEEVKSPPSRIFRGTFSPRLVCWLGWIIRPSLSIQIIGYDNSYEIS
jgi:hypothetical protein